MRRGPIVILALIAAVAVGLPAAYSLHRPHFHPHYATYAP